MVWRSLGRGFAALVIGLFAAMFIDQLRPLGAGNAMPLIVLFICTTAWWSASRCSTTGQGALHGTLAVLVPAAAWTFLHNALQYEWGGPGVFNIDHLYYSLFLLVPPLMIGAAVGAAVGYRNARKVPLP
ncbi:MAG TPA: hypothetical protein VD973_27035 [Symbiobacteriaceae bacterium]|nr:hypothetical protein [Symbiobacteriaceae bacterium]